MSSAFQRAGEVSANKEPGTLAQGVRRPQTVTSPPDQQTAASNPHFTPRKEAQPALFFHNGRCWSVTKTRADKDGNALGKLELPESADGRHLRYCVLPEILGKSKLNLDDAGCLTKVNAQGAAESLGPGSIVFLAQPGKDFLKEINARSRLQHRRVKRAKQRTPLQRRPRQAAEEPDVIVISSDSHSEEDDYHDAAAMAGGSGEAGQGRVPQACSGEVAAAGGSLPPLQRRGAQMNDGDMEMEDGDMEGNEKASDGDTGEEETEEEEDEDEAEDKDIDGRPTDGEETVPGEAVQEQDVQPAWTVFNSANSSAWRQYFSTEQVVFAVGSVHSVHRVEPSSNEPSTSVAGAKETGSEKGRFAVVFQDVVPVALPRVQLARDLGCLKKDGSHTQHHARWRLEMPISRSLQDAFIYYHSTAQALLEEAKKGRRAGGSTKPLREQEAQPFPPFPGGGYEQFLRSYPRGMAGWHAERPRPPRAQSSKSNKRKSRGEGATDGAGAGPSAATGDVHQEADPGGSSQPRKRPRVHFSVDAEADMSAKGNAGHGGGAQEDVARASSAAKKGTAEGEAQIPHRPPHPRPVQQGPSRAGPSSGVVSYAGMAAEPDGDSEGGVGVGSGGTTAADPGPAAAPTAFDSAVCRHMPRGIHGLGPMSHDFAAAMEEAAKRLGLDNQPAGLYKVVHRDGLHVEPMKSSSDPRDLEINKAVSEWLEKKKEPKSYGTLETISDACHPCFNNRWMGGKQRCPQARLVAKDAMGRLPFLGLYTGRLLLASEDAAITSADVTGEIGLQATVTVSLLTGAAAQDLVLVGDRKRSALTCINSADYWGKCSGISGRANIPCNCDVHEKAMREHNAEFIHCVLKLKKPVKLQAWVPQQATQQGGTPAATTGGAGAAGAATSSAGTGVPAAVPCSTLERDVRTQYIPLLPVVATRNDVQDGAEWLLPSGYGEDDYYRIVEDNHRQYFHVQDLQDKLRVAEEKNRRLAEEIASQSCQLQAAQVEMKRAQQEVFDLKRDLQDALAVQDRLQHENAELRHQLSEGAAPQHDTEPVRLTVAATQAASGHQPAAGGEPQPETSVGALLTPAEWTSQLQNPTTTQGRRRHGEITGGSGVRDSDVDGSDPVATPVAGAPGGVRVLPVPSTPPEEISRPAVQGGAAAADAPRVSASTAQAAAGSSAAARQALQQLMTTQDPAVLLLLGPIIIAVRDEMDCKEAEIAVVKASAVRQERALRDCLETLRAEAAGVEARLQQRVLELKAALQTEGELRDAEAAGRAADAQQHKARLEEEGRAHAAQLEELRAARDEEVRRHAAQLEELRAAHRSEIAIREDRIRLLRGFVERVMPVIAEGQQLLG